MDASTLATAGLSTGSLLLIGIVYKLVMPCIGKRLVSNCCGKIYEVGLDVRGMPSSPSVSSSSLAEEGMVVPVKEAKSLRIKKSKEAKSEGESTEDICENASGPAN
jgi:hypothetical protein